MSLQRNVLSVTAVAKASVWDTIDKPSGTIDMAIIKELLIMLISILDVKTGDMILSANQSIKNSWMN